MALFSKKKLKQKNFKKIPGTPRGERGALYRGDWGAGRLGSGEKSHFAPRGPGSKIGPGSSPFLHCPGLLHFPIFCQIFEKIRLKTVLNPEIFPGCYTFLTYFVTVRESLLTSCRCCRNIHSTLNVSLRLR